MQTLIYKKLNFDLLPHFPPPNYFFSPTHRNHNFLRIHPKRRRYSFKTRTLCSTAHPQSLSCGGWDDYDSIQSTESNELHNLLNFLGIGDKKYVFVYLFGFVCALAISRVKISTIIVFPACATVFALGFTIGLVKGGQSKELKLNGNRRNLVDETLRLSIEKLRSLKDSLMDYKAKAVILKDDIRRSIECNQVTVSDLEGYLNVVDSIYVYFSNAIEVVEGCLDNISGDNRGNKVGFDSNNEPSKRKKKFGVNGLDFAHFFDGLFREKVEEASKPSSKVKNSSKRELMNSGMDDQKQANVLAASAKQGTLNSAVNEKFEDDLLKERFEDKEESMLANSFDNNFINQDYAEKFADGSRMKSKRNLAEKNDTARLVFDQTEYSYQNNTSRIVNNERVHFKDFQDQTETMASHESSYDSIDFSISMKKTSASFRDQTKRETLNRSYSDFDNLEEDQIESRKYSFQKEMLMSPLERPFFNNQETQNENIFGDDMEFNRYLGEANNLLKETKECLRKQVREGYAEKALNKSAILLSKAIDMRPMSLLAVGQLGNTYLLHGELKLRVSREIRSSLAKTDKFEDQIGNKDMIKSSLVDVCEECEELLIKAGRKYKLVLSIDGSDMRALYNWGLALGFRAQLIADVGPSAARDADKVFLAAIDKFDAMLSKSNVYAPDALFRWGAALQQRSRLRPRNNREKVKLLEQARCLYEDALYMDSANPQLQKALSSCLSELDYYCYR